MIGTTLQNRYRLDSELGRGGMGVVYRAHDTLLDRAVAVKVLSDSGLGTEGRARLLREAQSAAKLNHPNIVTVYDAGEADLTGGADPKGLIPFVVMELVEGESLFDRKPQSLDETFSIALQLCAALDHAHTHGIIHRDLKPENILVAKDGTAKLMDFGLARSTASRLTTEGAIIGTVFYLAPEQALGEPFDGRADLYSLGVLLYELAAGRLPFEADNALGVISQHIHAPVVPPRAHNEGIPPALDALIVRLLSKQPDDRPASANEVLQTLDRIDSGEVDVAVGGEPSLLDRMVRGRLVGRSAELNALREHWTRAQQGHGHLVLISGEPGVGKTRLANELIAHARLHGALVLEGHFHPELGVTYLGIREALRDYLRSLPPEEARAAIGPTAPELVKLVPEVEALVGSVTPNPPMGELEAERLRLFDHVAQFMISLMKKSASLFVLEDLHWADGPSLLFLHFLLRNARNVPLLVLGTYRETELDPVRPFYETLLGLNRDRLYTRVALRGLEAEGVASLVNALLDGPVEAELVAAVTRDTEGNPFFVEEVVKGLVERKGLRLENGVWRPVGEVEHFIPQSIQIALGKRLEALSEDARAALALASILGREFDVNVLLSMSEWGEDRMLDALDEAIRAQLIAETRAHGKGEYRFAHALLTQVVYDGINARRRARFHQQAGEALERVYARKLDGYIEALAYHYSRAPSNAADKAVTYGLRAAEKAAAVYAHDQAIRHYTEVLEALHDLDDPAREAQAWELMGDAKMRLYYVKEATTAYENALAVFEKTSSTESHEHCRLSYKLGELIIREQKDPRRARVHLERALASPAAPPESPQRAKCLAALAVCLVHEGLLEEAQAQAENAIELAERLEYPDGIASACGALCSIHEARGDLASYARLSERQVAALDQCGDLYGIFNAYDNVIGSSLQRGDYAQMEKFSLAGLELCRKFNAPGWEGTIMAGYMLLLKSQGRWDEALKHGERVLPLFERVGCSTCFMYVFWNLADIEARRGHAEQARRHMDSALDIIMQLDMQRSPEPAATLRWRRFGHVIREEWEAAWALVEESRSAGYPDFGMTSLSAALWSTMVAETAARAGNWSEAERLATEAMALFQGIGVPIGVASSHFALGLAYAGQHKWDEALAEFKHAVGDYQALGHPWDVANARYEMALAFSSRRQNDDLDQAKRLLQQAHSAFKSLEAEPGRAKVSLALEQIA